MLWPSLYVVLLMGVWLVVWLPYMSLARLAVHLTEIAGHADIFLIVVNAVQHIP